MVKLLRLPKPSPMGAASRILFLGVLLGSILAVPASRASAGTNDYPASLRDAAPDSVVDPWRFWNRECTSFVAWRLNSRNGFAFKNDLNGDGRLDFGNASNWPAAASAFGFPVDGRPAVGSVAAWSGHVAWVEAVNADGTITVEDYNWGLTHQYNEHRERASSKQYLHFKDMQDGSPFGSFDGASGRVGGAAQVSGWTIDPDAPTTPTAVHVYVDGPAGSGARGVSLGLANLSRPDVAAAFPGAGDAHGFNTTITGLSPGVHTLYAYAINAAGGGSNPLLRTLQATVPGPDPIGTLDLAQGAMGGSIAVNGWMLDPDAPTTSGWVHVYIDGPAGSGARVVGVPAAVDRPDVAAAYPGAGPVHGFSTAIGGISPGVHKVYAYLINVAGGGSNPLLATASVSVPTVPAGSPFGSFDGATGQAGGAAQVGGWTIDPDAPTTPTAVHVYVDGPAGSGARGVNLGLADLSRPDVAAAFPGSGDAHGFNATITGLSPGVHTLWAYAINAAGNGANPLLRTLQATVPS